MYARYFFGKNWEKCGIAFERYSKTIEHYKMCGPTADIQQVDVARLTWDDMNNRTETIVPTDTQPRGEGCTKYTRSLVSFRRKNNQLHDRFSYSFIYFHSLIPYPLICLKPKILISHSPFTFRAESPCIGHYRECIPLPASSRLCMVQFYLLLASFVSCL